MLKITTLKESERFKTLKLQ